MPATNRCRSDDKRQSIFAKNAFMIAVTGPILLNVRDRENKCERKNKRAGLRGHRAI
jgi:hypothetical protein